MLYLTDFLAAAFLEKEKVFLIANVSTILQLVVVITKDVWLSKIFLATFGVCNNVTMFFDQLEVWYVKTFFRTT